MNVVLEQGKDFADSLRSAMVRWEPVVVARRLATFVDWKMTGIPPRVPFSADKWSGRRPDGTMFEAYVQGRFRHCHLDIEGTEPLSEYRQFDAEAPARLVLVCITTHREMFGGNERAWMRRYFSRSARGTRLP